MDGGSSAIRQLNLKRIYSVRAVLNHGGTSRIFFIKIIQISNQRTDGQVDFDPGVAEFWGEEQKEQVALDLNFVEKNIQSSPSSDTQLNPLLIACWNAS